MSEKNYSGSQKYLTRPTEVPKTRAEKKAWLEDIAKSSSAPTALILTTPEAIPESTYIAPPFIEAPQKRKPGRPKLSSEERDKRKLIKTEKKRIERQLNPPKKIGRPKFTPEQKDMSMLRNNVQIHLDRKLYVECKRSDVPVTIPPTYAEGDWLIPSKEMDYNQYLKGKKKSNRAFDPSEMFMLNAMNLYFKSGGKVTYFIVGKETNPNVWGDFVQSAKSKKKAKRLKHEGEKHTNYTEKDLVNYLQKEFEAEEEAEIAEFLSPNQESTKKYAN